MAKSRITSSHVDAIMAAARRRDEKMEAMVTYTEDNQKLAHAAKAEIDIANRRRAQHMSAVQAEERVSAMIEHAEYAARNEERLTEQNKLLAAEFERRRTERERKEREIQRICQESEELRDLERHLKTAYMNKERAAQHEERVILNRIEREQQQAIEDAMEVDRQTMQAAEREKEKARKFVGLEQKAILHMQMEEREELLRQAKMEAARDKELVDEIVAKLEAEDSVKAAIIEKNKNETRAIIKAYEIQRKQEVLDAKAAYEAEEAEIKAHLDAMAKRNEGVAQKRADKEAAQAAAFKQIAEEAEKKRLEEDELARLRNLLWEEELEAKRKAEEDGRIAARANQKVEMARANEQMLASKAAQREIDMAEENRLVNLMLKKFAEDEEKERKAAQRREDNRARYKHEIEEQQQQRLQMYEKEKAAELEGVNYGKEEEEYRKAVVAEARRRLLEEHAKRLHGFLPKGALQSKDELKLVNASKDYIPASPPRPLRAGP